MGAGNHGGFGATKGMRKSGLPPLNLQFFASKAFKKGGQLTEVHIAELNGRSCGAKRPHSAISGR